MRADEALRLYPSLASMTFAELLCMRKQCIPHPEDKELVRAIDSVLSEWGALQQAVRERQDLARE